MNSDLARAVEEFGTLVGVRAVETATHQFESVIFDFEHGALNVSVNGDWDTIELTLSAEPLPPAPTLEPWSDLLSSQINWTWTLTNNRGFLDGIQIEFQRNGEVTSIQMIAEASNLTIYRLKPLI